MKIICVFTFLFSMSAFGDSTFLLRFSKGKLAHFLNTKNHLRDVKVLSEEMGIISFTGTLSKVNSLKLRQDIKWIVKDRTFKLRGAVTPNDSSFVNQWSLLNRSSGNVKTLETWQYGTGGTDRLGSDIVVAVIDNGMDPQHKDLKNNLWINRGEIPSNGIDDDGNGYIDDTYGWNAYENDGSIPSINHGTHVAGIIGAEGNNNFGISGINWNVKIMSIIVSGFSNATLIKGFDYIIKMKKRWLETQGKEGANIVVTNSSFGADLEFCDQSDFSIWNDLYNAIGELGIISVAATTNGDINVEEQGDVPSTCSSPYLIVVTNLNQGGVKYKSAGYGVKSVDLAAPGTDIYSTTPDDRFMLRTGCSYASPHVAGGIALIHSLASVEYAQFYRNKPQEAALFMKNVVLEQVTKNQALINYTKTGGQLNILKPAQILMNYK